MSAIDHAFIRAYTLDTVPAADTIESMPRAAVSPQRMFSQTQWAVKQSSVFSPLGPATMPIAAPASETANFASLHGAIHPSVPAPHFRLASFVHCVSTLESPQTSVEFEPLASEDQYWPEPAAEPILQMQRAPDPIPLPEPTSPAADLNLPSAGFEVDQFVWPEICDSLLEERGAELDQLAAELANESAVGRRIVAITGSRRGDGRSTLALLLARRVAATGAKVCLVDADFEVPQLAARLGMSIETGWEKLVTDGGDLWDAMIESVGDRLTLLPLAPRPAPNAAIPPAAEFAGNHAETIAQHFDILRNHFDLVLVDSGPMKSIRADGKPRGPLAMGRGFVSAVLVSDARLASPGRIAELHRRLVEADLTPLGIAENFCARNELESRRM